MSRSNDQSYGSELSKTPPEHHDRQMINVEDRNSNSPFYGQRIWWCADCHLKIPVRKEEIDSSGGVMQ